MPICFLGEHAYFTKISSVKIKDSPKSVSDYSNYVEIKLWKISMRGDAPKGL